MVPSLIACSLRPSDCRLAKAKKAADPGDLPRPASVGVDGKPSSVFSPALSSGIGGGHFSCRAVAGRGPQRPTRPAPPGQGVVPGKAVNRGLRGLARGGVFRAPAVASRAVRSYRTFSSLPDPPSPGAIGGLFSVALSVVRDMPNAWALPTAVSCRARTFLTRRPEGRLVRPPVNAPASYAHRSVGTQTRPAGLYLVGAFR